MGFSVFQAKELLSENLAWLNTRKWHIAKKNPNSGVTQKVPFGKEILDQFQSTAELLGKVLECPKCKKIYI